MIRITLPDDVPAIAELERSALPSSWSEDQIHASLGSPGASSLVDAGPEGLRGYVLYRRMDDEAELLRLAVDPDHRRRGLATALVAAGNAALAELGVHTIYLEVRCDDPVAGSFYTATGWTEVGLRKRYYPDGTDARILRRDGKVEEPGPG